MKTFYEVDLNTSHYFDHHHNQLDVCDELGNFYESRSELLTTLSKCIRFKSDQLLYCHDGLENFRNYSK